MSAVPIAALAGTCTHGTMLSDAFTVVAAVAGVTAATTPGVMIPYYSPPLYPVALP